MSLTNGPSDHLTWKELACKDGTPYPFEWRADRAFTLSRAFESIRQKCGNKPITILSAYRTPTWNKKVGGAKNSQHLQGRALDLLPPAGMTVEQLLAVVKLEANKMHPLIHGIGIYKTFVHIDIRPIPNLVVWNGGVASGEATA